jgi:hypothetical protein
MCPVCCYPISGKFKDDLKFEYRHETDYEEDGITVHVVPSKNDPDFSEYMVTYREDTYIGDVFDQDSDFINANLGWD